MDFSFTIYLFLCPQVCDLPCLLPQQLNHHLWHRGRSQLDYWRVHIHILKKKPEQTKPKPHMHHVCIAQRSGLILYHFSITLLPESFTAFFKCYFTAVDWQDLGGGESRYLKSFKVAYSLILGEEKSLTCFYTAQYGQLLPPSQCYSTTSHSERHTVPQQRFLDISSSDSDTSERSIWVCRLSPALAGVSWSQGWGRAVPRAASYNMVLTMGQGGNEKQTNPKMLLQLPWEKGSEILKRRSRSTDIG